MSLGILVAGIGNIFLGDDAFGVEVVQRLAQRELPPNVRIVDFGIRGFDLAYALMDDYDAVILVDAAPRGEEPGTLYLIEPDLNAPDESGEASLDAHAMNPMRVLGMAKAMGGGPRRILLVGCEPSRADGEDEERMGLSDIVEKSVDEAVGMIEELITKIQGGQYERVLESGIDHRGRSAGDSSAARP